MLIAENHLQFILEVAIMVHVGVLILFNIVAIPLSLVLFLALALTVYSIKHKYYNYSTFYAFKLLSLMKLKENICR